MSLDSWLDLLEQRESTAGVKLAAQLFEGPAQTWWRDYQKPPPIPQLEEGEQAPAPVLPVTNFVQFSKAVCERFTTIGKKTAVRREMKDLICASDTTKSSVDDLATKYQNLRDRMDTKEDHMWEFLYILPPAIRGKLAPKIPSQYKTLPELILAASELEKTKKEEKKETKKSDNGWGSNNNKHKNSGSHPQERGTARNSNLLSISTSTNGVRKVS